MIHLESLADAVVIVDAKGNILRVNSHAETLFGYARAEMIGSPIEQLVPQRFHHAHQGHRRGYQSTPSPRPMGRGMLTARHKSGREVPVEIMLSPDRDGSVVAVVRDVSKRRELEQFRDEYIGYISHDLKNPLSVITLQARLLWQQLDARGLDDEMQAIEVIAQSASFIDRLVRELLEMAYLESDQVELRTEPTELPAFLKAVLERTVSTNDRARIRLEIRDLAASAIEASRIERVVVNFVQNAIKYAPAGSPIEVRLEVDADQAVVSVSNEGAGISPEEASYIFDKYRRTESAKKRDGLGLGLYISRKIVEAHGGQIGVESTPGQGTTFFFTVPLLRQQENRVPYTITLDAQRADDGVARLRGLKVLLVDDEKNALSALTSLLAEEGLDVHGVTSGEQALASVQTRRPGVVVLDVEMPGMSGLAMLDRLRERIPELPAVIMSGHLATHAGISEARASGAAFIGKPVDVDELLRTLGRMFVTR